MLTNISFNNFSCKLLVYFDFLLLIKAIFEKKQNTTLFQLQIMNGKLFICISVVVTFNEIKFNFCIQSKLLFNHSVN